MGSLITRNVISSSEILNEFNRIKIRCWYHCSIFYSTILFKVQMFYRWNTSCLGTFKPFDSPVKEMVLNSGHLCFRHIAEFGTWQPEKKEIRQSLFHVRCRHCFDNEVYSAKIKPTSFFVVCFKGTNPRRTSDPLTWWWIFLILNTYWRKWLLKWAPSYHLKRFHQNANNGCLTQSVPVFNFNPSDLHCNRTQICDINAQQTQLLWVLK